MFGRLLTTHTDVGHALLNLDRDLWIHSTIVAGGIPALEEGLADAEWQQEDETAWEPATRSTILEMMGFDVPTDNGTTAGPGNDDPINDCCLINDPCCGRTAAARPTQPQPVPRGISADDLITLAFNTAMCCDDDETNRTRSGGPPPPPPPPPCGDSICGCDRCCAGSSCCGSPDPCCEASNPCCGDSDRCCNDDNPCCGSSDPCCNINDPCCGNPDPCCNPDNPCCGVNCDDGDPCTNDVCSGGECTHPDKCPGQNCCDGECCAGECCEGVCCDDEDPCTEDICEDGVCTYPDKADCTQCPDGWCINHSCLLETCLITNVEPGSACPGGTARLVTTVVCGPAHDPTCWNVPVRAVEPQPDYVFVNQKHFRCTGEPDIRDILVSIDDDAPSGPININLEGIGSDNETLCTATGTVTVGGLVDLDFGTVSDAEEINPGGFLCLNDDDDNDNGVADKDDTGTVTGEDDLVPLIISSDGDSEGTVELTCEAGCWKVKLYEDASRSIPVTLPQSWDVSELPKTLYVEGYDTSSIARDVELKATYTRYAGQCEDVVKLTVVKVDLDGDSNNDGVIDPDNSPSGSDDPIEAYAPGCIIAKDLEGDSAGADHLKQMDLRIFPALAEGEVELNAEAGIRIWEDVQKTTELALPHTYSPVSLPPTLFLDGTTSGQKPLVRLVYRSPNGEQIHEDKVQILVTETPSWAPAKGNIAYWWSSLPILGETDGAMWRDQITVQGFDVEPVLNVFRDANGATDDNFGTCTLANYLKLADSGTYYVISHGEPGAHLAVYAEHTPNGQAACDAWRAGQPDMTTEEDPGHAYYVRVSSKWHAAHFAPTANADRTISFWAICYSASGNPTLGETAVKEAAGGRWRVGYIDPTDETEARTVAERFLKRMNGTNDGGQKRTSGEAYDNRAGYPANVQMDGNAWTTLCPSPAKDDAFHPIVDPGARRGWGCVLFDTYMNTTVPPSEALIKVNGVPTWNHSWAVDTPFGRFGLGFGYDKTSGSPTTMRAVPNKCKNADPDGGRELDGNRVQPNGDNHAPWAF